jgi:hypothetical protein
MRDGSTSAISPAESVSTWRRHVAKRATSIGITDDLLCDAVPDQWSIAAAPMSMLAAGMAAVSTSTLGADVGAHISSSFRVGPILNLVRMHRPRIENLNDLFSVTR